MSLSYVLSYAGWAFLPRYATSFLQSLYYRITIPAGTPHPPASSPRYALHNRRIYILVVTSYLLYTLFETYHGIRESGDFYHLLGVLPTTDERTIKSRFRRLAALHHPDKLQLNGNEQGWNGDALFVLLKLAQDTLLDPAKRFAYDRFGQDVVQGSKSKTVAEFFYAGLFTLLPQYALGLGFMVFLNMIWFSRWGRYWRFYTFFALFTLELSLLTRANSTFMPAGYLPSWIVSLLHLDSFYLLPFQTLSLARRASVTLNIFISQLAPPGESHNSSGSASSAFLKPQTRLRLGQLGDLARLCDAEVTTLLRKTLEPFRGDRSAVTELKRGMKDCLVLSSVRDDPEVERAVKRVMNRKAQRLS